MLLAAQAHRWRTHSHWYPSVNIVLHFLRNGLTCGEVITDIAAGEDRVRHFGTRAFAWSNTWVTREWITKSAEKQAALLFEDLVKCDKYFADCTSHDEIESRLDRAIWYREEIFDRLVKPWVQSDADELRAQKNVDVQYKELFLMRACNVNALSQP